MPTLSPHNKDPGKFKVSPMPKPKSNNPIASTGKMYFRNFFFLFFKV